MNAPIPGFASQTGFLSDYPFKSAVDWFMGTMTASQYDADIHEVWKRVNYNYCTLGSVVECIRRDEVERVINTYHHMVTNDKNVPIFNYHYLAREPKPEQENLVQTIASKAQSTYGNVRKIMKQLEFADKDQSIHRGILNPRLVDRKAQKKPEGEGWENLLNWDWTTIGIVAGVGLGSLVVIKFMNMVD